MKNSRSRQSVLIELNIRWLLQALSLLNRLDAEAYSSSPRGFAPQRAGGHLRHILEFYQCFLDGLECGHIDYDARRRDLALETNCAAAASAIRAIIAQLETRPSLRETYIVWVRMEDADTNQISDCYMESSVSRELQVLSSHTIHHFALIALLLRMQGVEMDPNFGMAPSTLTYLAAHAAEAA